MRPIGTLMMAATFVLALGAAHPLLAAGEREAAADLERAITEASERQEQGALKAGAPFTAKLADGRSVTFAAESFDADLERAFDLLGQLLATKKSAEAATAAKTAPPAPAARPASRLDALRQAERKAPAAPAQGVAPPPDYSVLGTYRQSREARIEAEDKAAEADMAAVIAERQAAEADRTRKLERDQMLQAQATKWQDEMDRQASTSARAAAQWKAEHGPGAYAKRFLGTVIQTSVGAFTGGLVGTLSTHLADKAVRKIFKQEPRHYPPGGAYPREAGAPDAPAEGNPPAAPGGMDVDM